METIKQPFPTSKDLTKTSSNWCRQLFFTCKFSGYRRSIFDVNSSADWKIQFFLPRWCQRIDFWNVHPRIPRGGMIEFDDCLSHIFSSWVGGSTTKYSHVLFFSAFGVLPDFFQARCGPKQDWLQRGANLGCFPKTAVNEGLQSCNSG